MKLADLKNVETKNNKITLKKAVISSALLLLLCVTNAFATPVDASAETIYILMNTTYGEGEANPNQFFRDIALKNYIQSNFVAGDSGKVYCTSYNIAESTPAVFAKEYIDRVKNESLLDSALSNWFKNSTDPWLNNWKKQNGGKSVDDLKEARPDRIPRFVIVAEGASGLAVREYIQSSAYRGDVSNVLFFNTPHEGSGFADQAVFNHTEKLNRNSDDAKYAELIPLALVAYLVDGEDGLQEMMISLLKDAVMRMAYSVADINKGLENIFDGYGEDKSSSWYIAQDADENDEKYMELVKAHDADTLLGSLQLLNSYSKNSEFQTPAYNIVYSYGLPTIGNGRRTLDDFFYLAKNHISSKKLAQVLADSLGVRVLNSESREELETLANSIVSSATVQEALNGLGKYADKLNDIKSVFDGLSELRSSGFNKDNIPGSVYNLMRIIEKFIPSEYKSEVSSLFMEYFSPETSNMLAKAGDCAVGGGNLGACARAGISVAAANLSNYSLNFLDEGTLDVPAYSAIGENVAAFRAAGASRFGYEMNEIIDKVNEYEVSFNAYRNDLDNLKNYRNQLAEIGEIETDRKIVDFALNEACKVTKLTLGPGYGKACSTAEFATNVALVGVVSSKIKKITDNAKSLGITRNLALMAATHHKNFYSANDYHNKIIYSDSITDIEKMLFSTPVVSIASVRNDDSVIPLLMSVSCADEDVVDFASFNKFCGDTSQVAAISQNNFREPLPSQLSTLPMTVKDVVYDDLGRRKVKYGELEYFTTQKPINEFRFQIDDLQPDSVRWFKIDFNARVQVIYERIDDKTWNVYYEKNYQEDAAGPVFTVLNPIAKNGLFIFRPQQVLDEYNSTHQGDTQVMSSLLGEGTNVIYISLMNRIGMSSGYSFSFQYQATKLIGNPIWPERYADVSTLNNVSVLFDNYANDNMSLRSVGLKVTHIGEKVLDSVDVHFENALCEKGSSTCWVASADVDSIWKSAARVMSDGDYMLDWNFNITIRNGQNVDTSSHYHVGTRVHVDHTLPGLKLVLPKSSLLGLPSDGAWASVRDTLRDGALRAMRGTLVENSSRVKKKSFLRC